jgi:hypothetical protein
LNKKVQYGIEDDEDDIIDLIDSDEDTMNDDTNVKHEDEDTYVTDNFTGKDTMIDSPAFNTQQAVKGQTKTPGWQ